VRLATVVGRILVSNVALFLVALRIAVNIAKLPELLSAGSTDIEARPGMSALPPKADMAPCNYEYAPEFVRT
jgi:hypothetical protein